MADYIHTHPYARGHRRMKEVEALLRLRLREVGTGTMRVHTHMYY